jgi:parallel beta-helix repeat protein
MEKYPLIRKGSEVGIILLFIGIAYAPAIAQNTEKQSASRGTWLYVGGSGPGNYTKIQDAIDNASDEDTVYVYNRTYNEFNISIRKSIFLLGEDKYSTIIDANLSGNCIDIFSDNVTVRGFTVRDADFPYGTGIAIYSHNTTICDNIITNNDWFGIHIQGSNNNNISYNIISNNRLAGIFGGSSKQIIIGNKIMDNDNGISLSSGSFIVIKHNNISSNNVFGIQFDFVTNSSIIQNNFFNNKGNAVFVRSILGELRVKLSNELFYKKYYKQIYDPYYTPWKKNIWDGNYWSRSRILPKPIFGSIRITGRQTWFNDIPIPIDCVNFDWHPAQEPYDIKVKGCGYDQQL